MSKLVELFSYQPKSFSASLRQLYRSLENFEHSQAVGARECEKIYQELRGHFLFISRKKKNITIESAGKHIGIPWMLLEVIEKGRAPITDLAFIHLCQYYDTAYEASVLARKIEEALIPKLRHSRD